jgi:small subunit ribosomal protein S1
MSSQPARQEQTESIHAQAGLAFAEPSEIPANHWFRQVELDLPSRGELREGTVVHADMGEIRIDVGGKSEGVLDSRELERMSRNERSELDVGQQLQVYVVTPEDRDGNLVVSLSKAQEEMDWRWAEDLLESEDVHEGEISGYNKGGLLVQMRSIRGFLPGSHIDHTGREIGDGTAPADRWGHLLGERAHVKVIEVDRSRNRLIVSERAAMQEVRELEKERLLEELEEGEIRQGRVSSLVSFGAFVDLGGADGLVHLSELSWKRVSHPREVVQVGDEVDVYVLNVDQERRRIGLSLKRLEPDPWWEIEENLHEGSLVEGSITKLTDFGAFATIGDYAGFEGLIHISELSYAHVEHPREVVHPGQEVTMRVIRVDNRRRRVGLSLKQVASDEYLESDWSSLSAEEE